MLRYIMKKQLDNTLDSEKGINVVKILKDNITKLIMDEILIPSSISPYLRRYLDENCFLCNSLKGDNFILTQYKNIDTIGNIKEIPYIGFSGPIFYMYKNCIIYNAESNRYHKMVLRFIRGTLDINQLLTDAYEYTHSLPVSEQKTEPFFHNFHITEHFGTADVNPMFNIKVNDDSNTSKCNDITESPSNELLPNDLPLIFNKDRILDLTIKREDPFENYYYPKKIVDYVTELSNWLSNDLWFIERQLPYKRGILLHGPAGTGKSSFAKVLGLKFGIPIHQFHLSNMTDKDFKDAWSKAVQNSRVIILIEDFDNVYHGRTPVNSKTKLNFDTVLNTISGINDMNGVILIITTNDITKIDPAIGVSTETGISTRPGRIDSVIYLGAMESNEKYKLASKILKDWPPLIDNVMQNTNNYTAAQVQEYSIKLALEKLNETAIFIN